MPIHGASSLAPLEAFCLSTNSQRGTPMSETTHPPQNYLPPWGGTPRGVRSILVALSVWADESLMVEARVSEIVEFLDLDVVSQ